MSILAPAKAYFKYSFELKAHFPVIAYYCKLFGVTKGFEVMKQHSADPKIGDVKAYLMGELKDLESMKAVLGSTTKEDHKPEVENFLLSVFAKTDKEERNDPQITKNHALSFKRCGDFIEILTQFGQMEPEWQERAKYCKYKAGTILKCLKNGEEPPRGNPFAQEEEELPQEQQEEDTHMQQVNNSMHDTSINNGMMEEQKHNPYIITPQAPVYEYQPKPSAYQPPPSQPSYPGQNSIPNYNQGHNTTPTPPVNPYITPQQQHPQIHTPIQAQSMSGGGGGPVKKDATYYKAIADAKKKAQNAVSELDFSNLGNAVKFFREALAILQPYENS